jgi:hypothetical protein
MASTAHLFAWVLSKLEPAQRKKIKNDSLQTKAKDKSTTPYMFEAVNDLPIIFVHHHR